MYHQELIRLTNNWYETAVQRVFKQVSNCIRRYKPFRQATQNLQLSQLVTIETGAIRMK